MSAFHQKCPFTISNDHNHTSPSEHLCIIIILPKNAVEFGLMICLKVAFVRENTLTFAIINNMCDKKTFPINIKISVMCCAR